MDFWSFTRMLFCPWQFSGFYHPQQHRKTLKEALQSQLPQNLRHIPFSITRTLESCVRIPFEVEFMSMFFCAFMVCCVGTDLEILGLGIRWRWVARFTARPPYSSRKNPFYRRLGGIQSQSGSYGEEKRLLSLPRIEPRLLGRPYCSIVAIPTELSRLPMN
jgi:hypothetical protein